MDDPLQKTEQHHDSPTQDAHSSSLRSHNPPDPLETKTREIDNTRQKAHKPKTEHHRNEDSQKRRKTPELLKTEAYEGEVTISMLKVNESTQTIAHFPKLYLTETWMGLRTQAEKISPLPDFMYQELLFATPQKYYNSFTPEIRASASLESEDSFVRLVQNHNQLSYGSACCSHDSSNMSIANVAEIEDKGLWYIRNPKLVEKEILANKAFVTDFLKSTELFTATEMSKMVHHKRARRKLATPLFAVKNKPHRDDTLQYKVGSVRNFEHKQAVTKVDGHKRSSVRTEASKYIYELPPNSVFSAEIPMEADSSDYNLDNMAELNKDIFQYAQRQKSLLHADFMAFYAVKKVDEPMISLELYPPRRQSPTYARAMPESLQYGLGPTSLLKPEPSISQMSEKLSNNIALPTRTLNPSSANIATSKSQVGFLVMPRRGTLTKEPDLNTELILDLRDTDNILSRIFVEQTWSLIVNLPAYLSHGCRFLPNVPEEATSSMLIPIGIHDGRLMGLLSFMRFDKKPAFSEAECAATNAYVSYMVRDRFFTSVRNEQMKTEERLTEEVRSILMLKDAANEEYLHHVLMLVKNLTDADRSSSFLVNVLTECMKSEKQLIPHHLGTGTIDPMNGRPSYRRGHDIRMSVDRGIVGCAFRHRKTYASSANTENRHFFTELDKLLSNRTENVVCLPFLDDNEPYGMVEVLNKKSAAFFTEQDIDMLHLNSIFPAVGVLLSYYRFQANKNEHLLNLNRAKTAYMRRRQFHRESRKWLPVPVWKPVPNLPEITRDMLEPSWFFCDHLHDSVALSVVFILESLSHLRLSEKMVYRFVESVRTSYSRVKSKDWKFAFCALHAVFVMVQETEELFTDEEKLTMMVGALCHGVDHFWYNATVLEGMDGARGWANVFTTVTPESSCIYGPSVLLRDPETNIFGMYKDKTWKKILENCRNCTSAVQIPILLSKLEGLKDTSKAGKLNLQDNDTRQQIRELVTAAASLSYACKQLELFQELARCCMEEYRSVTAELSASHGAEFAPRWTIPEDPAELQEAQAEFLQYVCLPVFDCLRHALPQTSGFNDCCVQNLERLSGHAVANQFKAGGAARRMHKRNVTDDIKSLLRSDVYSPVEKNENQLLRWTPLLDMEYVYRSPPGEP